MKRFLTLPVVVIALLAVAFGQTADENTIRLTYAKAMFANQVGILEKGAPQNLATNKLTFTLSDFQSGTIANNTQPVSSILSKPDGRQLLVLNISGETYALENTVITTETSLTAHWKPAPPAREANGRYGWDAPISLLSIDYPWANRYVSYQVMATYAGKTETYRAAFLFGHDRYDPFDMITDALPWANSLQQLYPTGLLRVLRDDPGVEDWLKANQVSATTCHAGELCCDPAAMKCGILPADLTQELAKPATPI